MKFFKIFNEKCNQLFNCLNRISDQLNDIAHSVNRVVVTSPRFSVAQSETQAQPLSREQVIGAYKLFLGRDPQNDFEIQSKLKCASLKALVQEFVSSSEFITRGAEFSVADVDASSKEIDFGIAQRMFQIRQEIVRSSSLEPSLEQISSQLCTASQFYSPIYRRWCENFHEVPRLHRKQWEFVYILEALNSTGVLSPGKRGIGFGCGKEPLPAVMANRRCDVIATDLDVDSAIEQGWTASNEHSGKLDDLYWPGICSKEDFEKRVSYASVNMNDIPESLVNFDFTWSSCAFEHLGSIEKGLQFVINSTKCLKSGGIAVHTTEFNLSSNEDTLETESLVFFRKKDIEDLIVRLEEYGCTVSQLNLVIGERVEDGFIDLPPFKDAPHLKLALFGYLTTSIGLIIKKN